MHICRNNANIVSDDDCEESSKMYIYYEKVKKKFTYIFLAFLYA